MKKGIIAITSTVLGAALGAGAVEKVSLEKTEKLQAKSDKHLALFLLMDQWVHAKQEGKNLSTYFERNGYKEIAIYGMSYAGETLLNELKDTETKVAYGIDNKADSIYTDIDIVTMDEDLEKVDAIVVTAITFFDEISEKLSLKTDCPIISLEDVLYEV